MVSELLTRSPTDGAGSAPTSALAAGLVRIARDLHREIHPRSHSGERAGLDSSLERDWGFDSLSRAELLLRVERAFSVHLAERLLGEAGTLRDLLAALESAKAAPAEFDVAIRRVIAEPAAEPAPVDATSLTAVLDWHVEHHGERVHIVHWHGDGSETSVSYGALARRSRAVALGLRQAGLEPGDRVAIMLPTGDAFFLAFFGALYAGGVPTPIYPPARPTELEEHLSRQAGILRNAGARLLVASPETAAAARLLRLQVASLARVITVEQLGQEALGTLPSRAEPESLALLQYTSGSTGDPKGVALSHRNLLANIRAMGEAMEASPADVFVSWLPLYHDMGLIGAWLGSLYFAAPLVVMSPLTFLVRPEQWLWAIHRHRGTLSAAPNFAFELCLREVPDAAIAGLDLSSLRLVANGSEAVSPETIRRFTARFARYGFRPGAMTPAYGLAENAVCLALPPLGRAPVIDRVERAALARHGEARPAAAGVEAVEFVGCGQPLPGHEIRIIDATGELGERREGRLQFRGPSATAGYFRNPVKTRELFDAAWLNSGDLAYIAGGQVFITGRSKDIIIRAGRHIYPDEIEAAVGDVPGIRKGCVAVFGTRDPEAGTERLVVLAESPETDPAVLGTLQRGVAAATARFLDAPPEAVILLPPRTIPKTASGKLRRSAARSLFEQGRLTLQPQPVWRQLLHLAAAGVGPQLRRLGAALGDYGYAAWWWSVVAVLGALLWPLVLAVPRPAARWAVLHAAARLAFRLMGIRLQVTGPWPPRQRAVIVANHASYLDGLVLAAALSGELAVVAKKELEPQVFAGPFLKALGTLFVDRTDPEGGVEDTRRALAAAEAGRSLVFFPEGTFTRAPGLQSFRLGAFVTAARQGLSVVPVSLRGTRSVLRGDQWFPRRAAVSVRIGAPIAPEGSDFAAALRLRDRARAAILAECGEPDLAGA